MSKTKRINLDRTNDDKLVINGVLATAVDLSYDDGIVTLTPVNERAKRIESRQLRVPGTNLEELVDSLLTLAQDEQTLGNDPLKEVIDGARAERAILGAILQGKPRRDWVFTFGTDHTHPAKPESGNLFRYYVRVNGKTWQEARDEVVAVFGMNFAFQYEADSDCDEMVRRNGLTQITLLTGEEVGYEA